MTLAARASARCTWSATCPAIPARSGSGNSCPTPGRIVSREALLTQVWGVSRNVDTRSIDTYASRLRKRLGLDGSSGWRLEGIYQHGYRLSRQGAAPDTPCDSAQ